jgi:predicted component of type VI protein secretion system
MAYLFVLNGSSRCKAFPLAGDAVVVGKSPECDVRIDDPWISWTHARLVREGDAWVVEDLDSTNGTYLNTEPVVRGTARDEDVIFFGRTHAMLVVSDRLPSAPPSGRFPKPRQQRPHVSGDDLDLLMSAVGGAVPSPERGDPREAGDDDEAERTMRLAFPLDDVDIDVPFHVLEELDEEDDTEVERDAFAAPPPEQRGVDDDSLPGLGGSFGAFESTDSMFGEPTPHLDLGLDRLSSPGGMVIDVADLVASSTSGRRAPGAVPPVPGSHGRGAAPPDSPYAAAIPGSGAQAELQARDQEIQRLRDALVERDEEIRRLREQLLRLKERYIDF